MTRMASGIVAVVLLSAGSAYGQGQVVSYHGVGTSGFVIIPEVPAGGLVITDVVMMEPTNYTLIQNGVAKYRSWRVYTNNGISGVVNLNSGIAFTEGSAVTVEHSGGGSGEVTLAGYIPSPSGSAVPAVGVWGLAIMVLLIVGAGTVVFRRMRVAA